ncbi:putative reverse transcriptase domain-containing protein [Tanacetum coccineum]
MKVLEKMERSQVDIKSLTAEHKCSRNYNPGSLVTYKWIARQYEKDIIADPFIPLLKMKADIRENMKSVFLVSGGSKERNKQNNIRVGDQSRDKNTGNLDLHSSFQTNASTESTKGHMSADNTTRHVSFATLLKGESSRKQVNFRTFLALARNRADVAISKESISIVSKRFCKSVYGSMMNINVVTHAIIMKEDMCNVLGWVKFHDILITAFTKDGLSVNATKLGTSLMLDYKTGMCLESWGRSSYARAMIELRVDVELKDTLVMDIPKLEGGGYTRSIICAEYEWKPPRCLTCKNDDDMGTNGGNLKLAKKGANFGVVSSAHRISSEAFEAAKKVDDLVKADSDSDVDVVYDETAQFMTSEGENDASLNKDENYDIYDTYDHEGLAKQQLAFCDRMDINLCGRARGSVGGIMGPSDGRGKASIIGGGSAARCGRGLGRGGRDDPKTKGGGRKGGTNIVVNEEEKRVAEEQARQEELDRILIKNKKKNLSITSSEESVVNNILEQLVEQRVDQQGLRLSVDEAWAKVDKENGFGKDGKGSTPNKAFSLQPSSHSKETNMIRHYSYWKTSIMIALNAKNKMKLVTGEFPEPTMESDLRAIWERNYDMLIS